MKSPAATHPRRSGLMLELVTLTERPWNAETPRAALEERLTPNGQFFVRNHFDVPEVDPKTYLLHAEDLARRPKGFTLAQLRSLPQRRVTAVLECAGNSRRSMVPRPPGLLWGDGAVGCATWEGPSLRDLLAQVGPLSGVAEVLFGGADVGAEDGRMLRFERSLPLAEALREGVIVALRMNGEALSPEHGAPARLVVPGWYGVASTKWLVSVRLLERPFTGWFQRDRYVWSDGSPVTALRPKTLILRPADHARVQAGPVSVRGRAWGSAGVEEAQVRADDGPYLSAALTETGEPNGWCRWSAVVGLAPGPHTVTARARDAWGQRQPLDPVVDPLGYGYNTAQAVRVEAVGSAQYANVIAMSGGLKEWVGEGFSIEEADGKGER